MRRANWARINGAAEQPRALLLSEPYVLKTVSAERYQSGLGRIEMFSHCYPAHRHIRKEAALLLTAAVVAFILLPAPARAQTETVLYNFNYGIYPPLNPYGCPPGSSNARPHTGLLFYKNLLYGTTPLGGVGQGRAPDSDDGMVFRLVKPASGGTPWKEQTLHSFIPVPDVDGLYPCSRLIEKNGVLYGTTKGGSAFGTVFALIPPATGQTSWTENVLYTFLGESDGGQPYDGLVMDNGGSLYGVNRGGNFGVTGPTVFQLTAAGTLNPILTNKDIVCMKPPCIFNGDLLLDSTTGALFGTTHNGGAFGFGNVYQLTPSGGTWIYDDLYDFTGFGDGANPNGALVGGPGDLFGTTQGGGDPTACEPGDIGNGCGVLFELRQLIAGNPYTLIVWHSFLNKPDGSTPVAGLYQDPKGTLWGVTKVGGSNNLGTIFELFPDRLIVDRWHYLEVYSFKGGTTDGANPEDLLTEDTTGNLYGTTNGGGSVGEGIVFQLKP